MLIIAAALSVQDPRERPLDKQEAADTAHLIFRDEHSDFLSYLKLWEWYHKQATMLSTSKVRKLCQQNFLSYTRMREWHDIHEQLRELLEEIRQDSPRQRGNVAASPHPQKPPLRHRGSKNHFRHRP